MTLKEMATEYQKILRKTKQRIEPTESQIKKKGILGQMIAWVQKEYETQEEQAQENRNNATEFQKWR